MKVLVGKPKKMPSGNDGAGDLAILGRRRRRRNLIAGRRCEFYC